MQKLNSEFLFTKIVADKTVSITLYLQYDKGTYDFMQSHEEGLMPRENNKNVEINRAYMELALEVLDFVEKEIYLPKE